MKDIIVNDSSLRNYVITIPLRLQSWHSFVQSFSRFSQSSWLHTGMTRAVQTSFQKNNGTTFRSSPALLAIFRNARIPEAFRISFSRSFYSLAIHRSTVTTRFDYCCYQLALAHSRISRFALSFDRLGYYACVPRMYRCFLSPSLFSSTLLLICNFSASSANMPYLYSQLNGIEPKLTCRLFNGLWLCVVVRVKSSPELLSSFAGHNMGACHALIDAPTFCLITRMVNYPWPQKKLKKFLASTSPCEQRPID